MGNAHQEDVLTRGDQEEERSGNAQVQSTSSVVKARLGRTVTLALIPFLVDVVAILIIFGLTNAFLVILFDRAGEFWPVRIGAPLQTPGILTTAERLACVMAALVPVWLVVSILSAFMVHTRTLLRQDREPPSE